MLHSCLLALFLVALAGDDAPLPADKAAGLLKPDQAARLDTLSVKPLHSSTHAELAEFMDLRKTKLAGELPPPADDIVLFAQKSIGQPYVRNAWQHDLSQGDCVTFTERCIALGCTDSWEAAIKIQNRLRYKDGNGGAKNLNNEPILDWIPNNAWLFDDVTDQLGAKTAEFLAVFEGREAKAVYVPKEELPVAGGNLKTGDIVIIVGDTKTKADPVVRTRAIHMGIIQKRPKRTGEDVRILQSYPPAANDYRLEALLRNPHMLGCKFLRLKADARTIVADKVANMKSAAKATPAEFDNRAKQRRGEFAFVTPSRSPDSVVVKDGVEYGVIRVKPGETLWSLFKGGYKSVVNLEKNQTFKAKHPDLDVNKYEGEEVYYPIRRVE